MNPNGDSSSDKPVPLEWNQTAAPYPVDRCIHHLIEEQVARTPNATALIFEHERLTYAELNRRANQLAHRLRALGAGAEVLVGICTRRSPEMLVGMLGILKAGAAYVALDPAYPRVRQAFMIEDAAMPILLTQQDLVDSLPVTQTKIVCLDSEWDAISQSADTNPDAPVRQQNLAYILYTSGSTGRPKGVAIEHRSVMAFLSWAHSVFSPDELTGTLAATSICFDLSVFEIFVPLTCGGAIILAENAVALPTLPDRDQVTLINTVPSAMTALINVGGVPGGVRVVNLAGEPLPNRLVQDAYRLPSVDKVYNLYGPSEDTTYSTFVLAEKGATSNPTIGRPISNTQVYIVNEDLQPMPIGTPGELCLGGDGLARGYLNRPELTEARFIANPFGAGRLYRTGDLARYLPDGNIEFMGRLDHQVKVRGYRIELGEIETALEQHSAIERAAVLALPGANGEKQLVAYMVANPAAVETLEHNQDTQEHVALWRNVYEDTYRQTPAPVDVTFNTSGWQSSYTGQPIPTAEMSEWLAQTVDRIVALRPRKVLEIGCGTGMILARVAPHCSSYTGLDFSETALDHIRAMQRTVAGLDSVTLLERSADDLTGIAPRSFDTVIINSVVQHFPDVDYLVSVLNNAVGLVKPGGHIFAGDIINLLLLEMFHASVQLHRAADRDTSARVKQRIRQQLAQGRGLSLAPAFFQALAQQQPAIRHVEAWPKCGRFPNELTRFRYDAILHVGDAGGTARDLTWMDWQRQKLTVAEVRRRLETRPETLALRNIPNARLDTEVAALAWLREAGPAETIAQFRAYSALQPRRGIEPDDLRLASEPEYRIELSWLNTDASGVYDAVFTRGDQPAGPARFASVSFSGEKRRSLSDYANHPQRARVNRELIPQVRQFLQEKLPHYMMPSAFTVLDQLPLSPTGKIDRGALAQLPVTLEHASEAAHSVQLSPMEELLAGMWADVLNLDRVGVDDDFFALGGDSLKAMALTHQLQRRLNRPFRPMTLLNAPTVAAFAGYLRAAHPDLTAGNRAAAAAGSGAAAELEEGDI